MVLVLVTNPAKKKMCQGFKHVFIIFKVKLEYRIYCNILHIFWVKPFVPIYLSTELYF